MADSNPYVGPTSFEERDSSHFFGRDEETRELVSLIVARRAVLLYAQSGAGKTSLLKASVIPSLKRRKRLDVFPIARVSGADSGGEGNVYVANALAHLTGSAPAGFAGQTIKDAIGRMLDADGPRTARLLAFDQFEEVFTFHPQRYDERKEFFQQLNDCLTEYPQLSLLLSMREDFLADLDSFAGLLPDRMRTRMRLERLPYQAAVAAVRQPAALAGKSFADGVAEQLVDNLRRVQVRGRDDSHALGKYVEPVQLQIVCWQLWSHLPQDAPAITQSDVEEYGDVDDALTKFYTDAVSEAQRATSVTERTLRRWFSEELITSARTRGLVYQGDTDTAGLPNEAVAVLRERYIIRADVRGGDTWYELAHDRLVEPILEDNRNWRASYRNPVAEAHERWESGGRDPQKLLNGNQLIEAQAYAAGHPDELSSDERKFLDTSIDEQKRVRRRRRVFAFTGTAVGVALAALAVWALQERAKAASALVAMGKASSNLFVQEAARIWRDEPDKALEYAGQALRADANSHVARGWVSSLLLRESWWVPVAIIHPREGKDDSEGRTGIRFNAAFTSDGLRIGIASGGFSAIWDANTGQRVGRNMTHKEYRDGLVALSPDGRHLVTFRGEVWDTERARVVRTFEVPIHSASFSPDGHRLVTVTHGRATAEVWDVATGLRVSTMTESPPPGEDFTRIISAAFRAAGRELVTYSPGRLSRWDVNSGNRLGQPIQQASETYAAFSADARRIVTARDWTVEVVDAASGAAVGQRFQNPSPVSSAALSADGRYIVTGSTDGVTRLWEADTGRFLAVVGRLENKVVATAFSPDARRIVSASRDGVACIWETLSGQPVSPPSEERSYGVAGQQSLEPVDEQSVFSPKVSEFVASFSPDGSRLIAISAERSVRLWETDTGKPAGPPLSHKDAITSVMFSRDGRLILTATRQAARVWDGGTGKFLRLIEPTDPRLGFFSAAFTLDSGAIITTGSIEAVWDRTGSPEQIWSSGNVHSVSYNPEGKLKLSRDSKGLVRVTQKEDGFHYDDPPLAIKDRAFSAVFTPKGDRVVIGAGNQAIVWDVKTRNQVGRPMVHQGSVYSTALSADGRLIVTGSSDRTAQLWNADTHLALGPPMLHRSSVIWAGFTPDGRRVATVAGDGVARLWTVLAGDGSAKDTALLVDLAATVSGGSGSIDASTRTRKIKELRSEISSRYPAGSPLRRLLGVDRSQ